MRPKNLLAGKKYRCQPGWGAGLVTTGRWLTPHASAPCSSIFGPNQARAASVRPRRQDRQIRATQDGESRKLPLQGALSLFLSACFHTDVLVSLARGMRVGFKAR